jgi:hypothetical protein
MRSTKIFVTIILASAISSIAGVYVIQRADEESAAVFAARKKTTDAATVAAAKLEWAKRQRDPEMAESNEMVFPIAQVPIPTEGPDEASDEDRDEFNILARTPVYPVGGIADKYYGKKAEAKGKDAKGKAHDNR